MDQAEAAQVLATPSPSAAQLAEVYMRFPQFREAVLTHPGLSTNLREWLLEQTRAGSIPPGPDAADISPLANGRDHEAAAAPLTAPGVGKEASPAIATDFPARTGDLPGATKVPTPAGSPDTVPLPPEASTPTGPSPVASWPESVPLPHSPAQPRAASTSSVTTDLVREIVRDDFSVPMTPRLLPLASRALWLFNGLAALALFLFPVIAGFKLLNISPGLGLMLMFFGIVAGPLEWVIYLFLNRLAFELYMNVHQLANPRDHR
ncbi:variant leucine-rich repeat-containing protein [Actinomyces provencensis]|uniref:variant leucine-rich repeat-containing protein n=1 Tax=Actinomyces provencensis TaxID=1720198 RepID=UPI001177D3EA|nr:hypothetical protein [Actinomyces provencensis]